MSSFTLRGRAACLALLSCVCLAAPATAQGRDHGVRRPAQQERDFYATVPAGDAHITPAASHECFTTSSPMEATKGIRHWSGRC
jgi:hypothetical protein